MDFWSKLFRSTLGFDRQEPSDLQKPREDFVFDRPDDAEIPRPEDIFRNFDRAFASFDRMFANFGSIFGNLQIDERDSSEDFNSRPESLRDQMLKQPDSEQLPSKDNDHYADSPEIFGSLFGRLFWDQKPFWNGSIHENTDSDLDEAVKMNGVDRILDRPREFHRSPHDHQSSFSRVSVNVRRSADGKIEQKRTTVDSEGNKTTVITRSVDGKTYEQTTTEKQDGEVEVKDDWRNIEPEEQKNFKERWSQSSNRQLEAPPSLLAKDKLDDKTESIFERLFGPRHT